MTKLSILIPSLEERSELLESLLECLKDQSTNEVEILTYIDNRESTTGAKRQWLIEQAKGDYVVFVDDDDRVSDDYVSSILDAIESNCDVICFDVAYKPSVSKSFPVRYSIKYGKDYQLGDVYYRLPNHLMPVKRELALKAGYPDKTIGEDAEYAKRLKPLIKSEHLINKTLYYYLNY